MDHESVLRALQSRTIWGAHSYTDDFQADRRPHRDAAHALAVHVPKAVGKVARFLRQQGSSWRAVPAEDQRLFLNAIADILICTLRGANTLPGSPVALASCFEDATARARQDIAWRVEDAMLDLLVSMGNACDTIDLLDHEGTASRTAAADHLCLLWLHATNVLAIVTGQDPDVMALSIVHRRLVEKGIGPA